MLQWHGFIFLSSSHLYPIPAAPRRPGLVALRSHTALALLPPPCPSAPCLLPNPPAPVPRPHLRSARTRAPPVPAPCALCSGQRPPVATRSHTLARSHTPPCTPIACAPLPRCYCHAPAAPAASAHPPAAPTRSPARRARPLVACPTRPPAHSPAAPARPPLCPPACPPDVPACLLARRAYLFAMPCRSLYLCRYPTRRLQNAINIILLHSRNTYLRIFFLASYTVGKITITEETKNKFTMIWFNMWPFSASASPGSELHVLIG
ncbi:hypothetical protein DFH08DRAFT_1084243 [Mycena albidolilacea]|uniref:Uncharacterized protein n=1 Tax=Mycena albidolilacea TaxID=1033008 RepID=A0AAD7EJZ1_9AGAR|nr:hypothetical protein DFH08DRAFT_1084243 [Mycena albidolilacea]